jgi:hypothetical protein
MFQITSNYTNQVFMSEQLMKMLQAQIMQFQSLVMI